MGFILDEFNFASLSIEDKDGANLLIGNIKVALGIDGHAVRLGQLPENLPALSLGSCSREAVHPRILLGLGSFDLREFFRGIEGLVADARDGWRIWPDDV